MKQKRRKRRKFKTPDTIDAGTLAQRARVRHPVPPPTTAFKDKSKYNRKGEGKPHPLDLNDL